VCGGRGDIVVRQRGPVRQVRCGLCAGQRVVTREANFTVHRLGLEMQRVADRMQSGDADGAATRMRVAARIAFELIAP
jgi:hypothetical protein